MQVSRTGVQTAAWAVVGLMVGFCVGWVLRGRAGPDAPAFEPVKHVALDGVEVWAAAPPSPGGPGAAQRPANAMADLLREAHAAAHAETDSWRQRTRIPSAQPRQTPDGLYSRIDASKLYVMVELAAETQHIAYHVDASLEQALPESSTTPGRVTALTWHEGATGLTDRRAALARIRAETRKLLADLDRAYAQATNGPVRAQR